MASPLDVLARHAAGDPFFLAPFLAAYAVSERLDDTGLAAALGCRPGDLTMLRLCRAPRSEAFWEDVTRIAERFALDAGRLAEVVKRGRVVSRLRGSQPASGYLLAAQDREGMESKRGRDL